MKRDNGKKGERASMFGHQYLDAVGPATCIGELLEKKRKVPNSETKEDDQNERKREKNKKQ